MLGSPKGLLCLLIIVVRIMQLKQVRRSPGPLAAQIEKDDRLAIGLSECRVNNDIIEFMLRHQHSQRGTRQVFFIMGDHHRDMFLALMTGIGEEGYPHADERYNTSKGGCQR